MSAWKNFQSRHTVTIHDSKAGPQMGKPQKMGNSLKVTWTQAVLSLVVVVVVGTYFEYMAVKPLIVPSYRHFFQRVCNACNNNFPKITYQSF